MLIGITYDLKDDYLTQGFTAEQVAEFDTLETIEAIESALKAFGHKTERIGHIKSLVKALATGKRWDLVFNIAEGVRGIAREAQVPALLDAYDIPYTFSDPAVLTLTLDKSLAKRVVREAGLNTAPFSVVHSEAEAKAVDLEFPLFVKPVAEGTSKGVTAKSLVRDRKSLIAQCLAILHEFDQPALVESYLPGREFTVGLLGTGATAEVVGVMEVMLDTQPEPEGRTSLNKEDDWKKTENFTLLEHGGLYNEIARICLCAWTVLGCRDAGRIDVRCDEKGHPHFIEVNPLAGLNPLISDLPLLYQKTGGTYQDLIAAIIHECRRRTKSAKECDIAV